MIPSQATASGERQAAHYDRILDSYDQHYFDAESVAYRREFILDPLLNGLDLRGKRVADLASGSGHTSIELIDRFPGIAVEGYDISSDACARYKQTTGRPAHVLDLTRGYEGPPIFDAAIIIGGLHHCVSDLSATLQGVAAMLKPGASFLMFEPNADFFLQFVRRLWYRLDHYFDSETEDGLSHETLLALAQGAFTCREVRYFGGPAFFLVLNSLIFRIPRSVKRLAAKPLINIERAYSLLPGRWPYASFTAHWIKSP